ncbi:MAG: tetratricopeptide repeat protein [bacterium]|nr:tetratricopeptide repeat protein [bacterium]
MSFIREDYREKKRKQRMIVVYSVLICVAAAFVWFVILKKPSDGVGGVENLEKDRPKTAAAQVPGRAKENPVKDLPTLVKEVKRAIVVIHTFDKKGKAVGQGSGFFINKKGHIISNHHVFRGAHRAEVKLPWGKSPVKKILAEDSGNDLILVLVGGGRISEVRPLPLAVEKPQVGEKVVVIGNPLGLEATVSDGIVSARRDLEPFGEVLQVTSPISPGSSGSPVFNMRGEVIGVATFQVRQGQNLNFAVPVAKVKDLVPTMEKEVGEVSFADSGMLGSAGDAFSRGIVYYNAGEYENALPEFQEAVKVDAGNAEAYFYLGMCYKANRALEAVKAFKNAIDLKSEYKEAYCNLGIVYNQLLMHKEAAEVLREAVQLDPDYSEALLNLGIAYAMDKEYRAAVSVLERAADIDMDARAYYCLGISYAATKQFTKAINALQIAVDLDSEMLDAYVGLGYAYAAVKSWRLGIKLLNQAVLIDPQSPDVRFLLGIMHLGIKDLDGAERQSEVLSNMRVTNKDEKKKRERLYKLRSQLRSAISKYKSLQRRGYRGY